MDYVKLKEVQSASLSTKSHSLVIVWGFYNGVASTGDSLLKKGGVSEPRSPRRGELSFRSNPRVQLQWEHNWLSSQNKWPQHALPSNSCQIITCRYGQCGLVPVCIASFLLLHCNCALQQSVHGPLFHLFTHQFNKLHCPTSAKCVHLPVRPWGISPPFAAPR